MGLIKALHYMKMCASVFFLFWFGFCRFYSVRACK